MSLATIAQAVPAPFPGSFGPGGFGPGPGFLFLLIPLLWIAVIAALFAIFGRRWRRAAADRHPSPARRAEATLAQRYAQGDIDESEYRARLEVIRTTAVG